MAQTEGSFDIPVDVMSLEEMLEHWDAAATGPAQPMLIDQSSPETSTPDQLTTIERLLESDDYINWEQEFEDISHRFDLRPGVRIDGVRTYITDLDLDETGDYDPKLENKRRKRPKKKRPIQHEDEEVEDNNEELDIDIDSPNESTAIDSGYGDQIELGIDADTLGHGSGHTSLELNDHHQQSKVSAVSVHDGHDIERHYGQQNFPAQSVTIPSGSIGNLPTELPTRGPKAVAATQRIRPARAPPIRPWAVRQFVGSRVYTIKTKFCHPIVFNYDDFAGDDECHFCQSAALPILGLQERRPQVRQLSNGLGWEELRGGHAADGTRNTKVCCMCTFQRLQIIACPKHEMQRILTWREPISFVAAVTELQSGQSKQIWCSICCNTAKWECCTTQESNMRSGNGCGLVLCELCTAVLSSFDNDLDQMVCEIKDQPSKSRPLGLRADYALFKKDGLLMKHIME